MSQDSKLVKAYASAVQGITAKTVTIEAQASRGTFYVGRVARHSGKGVYHQRIQAAMAESQIRYVVRRYIINMAPADLRRVQRMTSLPWLW